MSCRRRKHLCRLRLGDGDRLRVRSHLFFERLPNVTDLVGAEVAHRNVLVESLLIVVTQPGAQRQPRRQDFRIEGGVGQPGSLFESLFVMLQSLGAVTELLLEQTVVEIAPGVTRTFLQARL